ncbi:hypothetical protein P5673_010196 [Acropora cervicornis]|uniref:Uncharacterized protein n=1 Tax=Acropora cervicornis TaxID=6130 RepID=A0AAD9QQY5_ACRCE|nr:hypothetical protein P5673_010196 [Acropora cervicornis]
MLTAILLIRDRIRSLPSRIRCAMERAWRRAFARIGRSRDSERKLERFQSSIAKIFRTNSRGSRGPESSGFISDEEELEDELPIPEYSNTQLKIGLTSTQSRVPMTETDGPVEIEMTVFK